MVCMSGGVGIVYMCSVMCVVWVQCGYSIYRVCGVFVLCVWYGYVGIFVVCVCCVLCLCVGVAWVDVM
jgi:hypothetical protein